MAILLRSTRTGFFYVGYNRWRVYPDEAFDFHTLEQADEWVRTTHLDDVEIVHMPNPRQLAQRRNGSRSRKAA